MGIFESDEEALARRIKNIENMDKPIKFHQWFIPFTIFVLLPISLVTILAITHKWTNQDFNNLGWGLLFIVSGWVFFYLLRRFGVIPLCSW